MRTSGGDRTLLEYSIVSLISTIAIGVVLASVLIDRIRTESLEQHASFLTSYFASIPSNYPELAEHLVEGDGVSEHAADHFSRDLFLFPSIVGLRIADTDGQVIWEWGATASFHADMDAPSLQAARAGEMVIHPFELENDLEPAIHIYYPYVHDGEVVAILEVTDIDSGVHTALRDVRSAIVLRVALGGAVLYALLFFVFFRSYRRLRSAYNRLDASQTVTIRAMSRLAELRDQETGSHIDRTSRYCGLIADELSRLRKYDHYITDRYKQDLIRSAPLHDIGKVGIPDSILLKPGPLDEQEWALMKEHPILGARILEKSVAEVEFQSYFEIGLQVVLHHHENWDGSGYPEGLSGDSIPLSARVMALADVYDALRNDRPYKAAFPHEQTIAIIREERGRKLDPEIVDAFLRMQQDFLEVSTALE